MIPSEFIKFYGGDIDCIQGDITLGGLDFVLDLMDEYVELREAVEG